MSAARASASTTLRFIDTNVLLYGVSRDPDEAGRAAHAIALLTNRDLALSVHVLEEFYVEATGATRADRIEHEDAVGLIGTWLRFPVADITLAAMQEAFAIRARFGTAYRDALIIGSARGLGCEEILSQDLSDGQDRGGVRVCNPFAELGST